MSNQKTLTTDPSYGDLLTHTGLTVLNQETFGSYQGDYLFTVTDGTRHGIVIVGYGSCSGCDELEHLLSGSFHWDGWPEAQYREVTQFAQDLAKRVHWGDRTQLTEYLLGDDSYMRWYRHDDGFEESSRKALSFIPEGE